MKCNKNTRMFGSIDHWARSSNLKQRSSKRANWHAKRNLSNEPSSGKWSMLLEATIGLQESKKKTL